MNDIVLPVAGDRYRIGETEVIINDVTKRGRGYQVHVRIEGQESDPKTLRLKDFTKKATRVDA
jgi:hypothetical protein